jgi:LmbE family N-acetylglucosaminyl deacetylase
MAGTLLAVFAHPDDESLVAGGMLAACAAHGIEVHVVSLTRGELGPSAIESVADLGAERARELESAGRELGVTTECLTFPDGELDGVGDRATRAIRDRIRALRPDALLSFDESGLYWHPDHIAVHEYVAAAALHGPPVYEATLPEGKLSALTEAMTRRGLAADLWGLDPAAFGSAAEDLARVDVRGFLDRKLRALRRYRTQLGAGHALANVTDELARDFLGDEYLRAPAQRAFDLLEVLAP